MKTINKSVWKSWEIAFPATTTTPVVRKDEDGQLWAWVRGSFAKVEIRPYVIIESALPKPV
jgi:hypothetical protein